MRKKVNKPICAKIMNGKVVIMTFRIPEDGPDLYYAQNGHLFAFVLQNLDAFLRNSSKYQNKKVIKINEVRDKVGELVEKYGINPWEY